MKRTKIIHIHTSLERQSARGNELTLWLIFMSGDVRRAAIIPPFPPDPLIYVIIGGMHRTHNYRLTGTKKL